MEGVALVGELAAVLAHELKQPLTAILNNAETAYDLITQQDSNRAEIAEALADIIRDDARADARHAVRRPASAPLGGTPCRGRAARGDRHRGADLDP